MAPYRSGFQREPKIALLPIWYELRHRFEIACLCCSPVYRGFGVPCGDGSPVILIPGLLSGDSRLSVFRHWLGRIGYKPYCSGIGCNMECPDLLIRRRLCGTIRDACRSTGKKAHIVGHSLGGLMALALAAEMPEHIRSVITLAAPVHGLTAHPLVLCAVELVRRRILEQDPLDVLPACFTGHCSCDFAKSISGPLPAHIPWTAIYSRLDGVLEWRTCRTGDPAVDCEVPSTHTGLIFNPIVYEIVARKLALSS
jgi:triacylglycerol lipase